MDQKEKEKENLQGKGQRPDDKDTGQRPVAILVAAILAAVVLLLVMNIYY